MTETEWLMLTAAASGGFGNLTKRFPKLPKWALPFLVMAAGYLMTLARYRAGGMAWSSAAMASWRGLAMGLVAVGGHEALKPGAEKVLGKERAAKVLGKLPPPKAPTVVIKATKPASIVLLCALALSALPGCPQALGVLAKVAQGASWLGQVLDTAEAGAKLYHDRHPNHEREDSIGAALKRARTAATALEAAANAATSANDGKAAQARTEALEAYAALRALLDGDITAAKPPAGGAENDEAPQPEPFRMPTDAEVRDHL